VAAFDTAFHQKMPKESYLYAIPYGLYRKLGIRRYGFHGTSHRIVAQRAAASWAGRSPSSASSPATWATARRWRPSGRAGRSTPRWASRRSRADDGHPLRRPGSRRRPLPDGARAPLPKEVDALLNKRSGMLGISEASNDMREIVEAMEAGDERHRLAFLMFCHRVRKYIGAYAAVLAASTRWSSPPASARTRRRPAPSACGAGLPGHRARRGGQPEGRNPHLAWPDPGLVIPTNEELAIARDTKEVLDAAAKTAFGPSEEAIDRELAALDAAARRELVLLWRPTRRATWRSWRSASPQAEEECSPQALRSELLRLGLITPPAAS